MGVHVVRILLPVLASLAAALVGVPDGHAPSQRSAPAAQPTVVHIDDDGVRIERRRAIGVDAPEVVRTGAVIRVSGSVVVRQGRGSARLVGLAERTPSGKWRTLARMRTTRSGGFVFRVQAGSVARTRVFRVAAPRSRHLRPVATGRLRVRVATPSSAASAPAPQTETPAGDWDPAEYPAAGEPAPVGSASDWEFLYDGGSRWNPCAVIRWAYNAAGSYPASLEDMKRAFARVAGRTGLRFKYVGPTDYVAYAEHGGGTFPSDADIAVGWSEDGQVSGLSGGTVGLGGSRAWRVYGKDVAYRSYEGYIVLDREDVLRPGFDTSGSATWGQVMQHEALHVLGLGHAAGSGQLMYGTVSRYNHRYGAGDLTGMKRIGAEQGCL